MSDSELPATPNTLPPPEPPTGHVLTDVEKQVLKDAVQKILPTVVKYILSDHDNTLVRLACKYARIALIGAGLTNAGGTIADGATAKVINVAMVAAPLVMLTLSHFRDRISAWVDRKWPAAGLEAQPAGLLAQKDATIAQLRSTLQETAAVVNSLMAPPAPGLVAPPAALQTPYSHTRFPAAEPAVQGAWPASTPAAAPAQQLARHLDDNPLPGTQSPAATAPDVGRIEQASRPSLPDAGREAAGGSTRQIGAINAEGRP